MAPSKKLELDVLGTAITIMAQEIDNYISLTDIAKHKEPNRSEVVIQNWIRGRNTIEFLGVWEKLHNPDFKHIEFDVFRKQAGTNVFVLTPRQWIEATNAKGIVSKPGRYGGTYAHPDIAFEFAAWISVEFKLYLIKEFQRLQADENRRLALDWDLHRSLTRINYRIHTDAVKATLPPNVTKEQASAVYASEADLLNVALFGMTAREWRAANPGRPGNLRGYANVDQLVVLSNIESMNSELLRREIPSGKRLEILNDMAIRQLATFAAAPEIKRLKGE